MNKLVKTAVIGVLIGLIITLLSFFVVTIQEEQNDCVGNCAAWVSRDAPYRGFPFGYISDGGTPWERVEFGAFLLDWAIWSLVVSAIIFLKQKMRRA